MMLRICTMTAIPILALLSAGWGQHVSVTPSVIDSHPTVTEFRDDISGARIVVRAKIIEIVSRRDGFLGEESVIIEPIRIYKGAFESDLPCVRLEYYQSLQYKPDARLPDVGEEVILPLDGLSAEQGCRSGGTFGSCPLCDLAPGEPCPFAPGASSLLWCKEDGLCGTAC